MQGFVLVNDPKFADFCLFFAFCCSLFCTASGQQSLEKAADPVSERRRLFHLTGCYMAKVTSPPRQNWILVSLLYHFWSGGLNGCFESAHFHQSRGKTSIRGATGTFPFRAAQGVWGNESKLSVLKPVSPQ